jgi:acetylornithine deacetylase/succinyl-diaminopimelate desuccinylase-like protein
MDMNAMKPEAIEILRQYLSIDTTNPPGNEIEAARFLGKILAHEGIPHAIYESRPGRASLVARLKGDGTGRPLLLLNHMDVVGVERGEWSVEPFSGVVKDGFIWGRGALDMKGMGIMQLMAMLRAKRSGLKLSRDIIFLAVADEEANGSLGAKWMFENHPDEVDCEFVLNEGSYGIADYAGLNRPLFPVSTAEKGPIWLRIVTRGEAGHGSMPPDAHAVHRLAGILNRLVTWKHKPVLSPEIASLLITIGRHMRTPMAGWLLRRSASPLVWLLLKPFLMRIKTMRSMLAHSMSINMLGSGQKENVVPSRAEAVVDFRLLPETDPREFLRRVKARLKLRDEEMEVVMLEAGSRSASGTALFAALEYAIRRTYPQAVVAPNLSVGFSDSRFFRQRGITAYGIIPLLLRHEELDAIHGHDERIEIEAFMKGIDIIYDPVRYLNGLAP